MENAPEAQNRTSWNEAACGTVCFPVFANMTTIDDDTTSVQTLVCYEADPVREDMQLAD